MGLNLQAANTVINVDLPWNPAVLEQRIARAHRMGQKQPVQVYVLVTEQTIEENLLATIAAKKDLALAALDSDSDVDEVRMESGLTELKSRLEVLLGSQPEAGLSSVEVTAPVEPGLVQVVQPVSAPAMPGQTPAGAPAWGSNGEKRSASNAPHRERVAAAGGELLGAAFRLLGELVHESPAQPAPAALVNSIQAGLEACSDGGAQPRLTITLPNAEALNLLAQSLARLMVVTQPAEPPSEATTAQQLDGAQSKSGEHSVLQNRMRGTLVDRVFPHS